MPALCRGGCKRLSSKPRPSRTSDIACDSRLLSLSLARGHEEKRIPSVSSEKSEAPKCLDSLEKATCLCENVLCRRGDTLFVFLLCKKRVSSWCLTSEGTRNSLQGPVSLFMSTAVNATNNPYVHF
ncbi:hypothetical protein TGRUB_429850 [Toxoplasma gondii RUB]|uniref:Uncharacterized protein n=1 Tax=Toxoplasma gondii RUB TaxID=935652 RepID=A0A086M4G0_TOXGO|nr:hypothetical protein TGRUB_429850 [Toxoplasma gondii RUB]